jgi:hypothetical protein
MERDLFAQLWNGTSLDERHRMVLITQLQGLEMKLRNQIIIVNLSIAVGLCYEALRGSPKVSVAIVGVVLLSLVNMIFWYRAKKSM